MRKFAWPLLIALVPALVVTAVVSAQETRKAGKDEKAMSPLAAEVKAEVEKLHLQYRLDSVDLHALRTELRGRMMDELLKDKPDAKALEKIAKDMDALRSKMHRQRVEHLLKVKQALPPEHWKAFLHKQCGSFAGDCCVHGPAGGARGSMGMKGRACGAGGGMHGAGGCMCGAGGCMHGARGGMRGCGHGAAAGMMKHGRVGGAGGCTHGAGGCAHDAGGDDQAPAPVTTAVDECPFGGHTKGTK